ncbi:taste receptor type 2 member 9-like [Protobothrops mucrosquamatus]|uniref:taste receptor type 2 member 9-like n=1 Tax=Protobothrops mucrosquamatus TaxID=103944 RepID=UPI00077589C6|nr:taste receptor type 2 member 9-like [Protobothrops mucrosquamatus]
MSVSGVHNWLCLIITTAVTLVGMTGNGFIFLSDCHDWIRSKAPSGPGLLLMTLSLTRFIFLGITLGFHCFGFLDINRPKYAGRVTIFFWTFFNATTLWITTCLGVFYCVKIVNFSQPFLVKMKLRISSMVPHLLVAVVLVSLISALPFLWIDDHNQSDNPEGVREVRVQMFLFSILYILGTFPSFVIFLISSGFLIYSLVHHVKRMQNSSVGFRDQRMDVHLKTTKILTSFLILYAATFVAEISMTFSPSPWTMVISNIVVSSYNSGHTVALIVMNSKLRGRLCKMFWCFRKQT